MRTWLVIVAVCGLGAGLAVFGWLALAGKPQTAEGNIGDLALSGGITREEFEAILAESATPQERAVALLLASRPVASSTSSGPRVYSLTADKEPSRRERERDRKKREARTARLGRDQERAERRAARDLARSERQKQAVEKASGRDAAKSLALEAKQGRSEDRERARSARAVLRAQAKADKKALGEQRVDLAVAPGAVLDDEPVKQPLRARLGRRKQAGEDSTVGQSSAGSDTWWQRPPGAVQDKEVVARAMSPRAIARVEAKARAQALRELAKADRQRLSDLKRAHAQERALEREALKTSRGPSRLEQALSAGTEFFGRIGSDVAALGERLKPSKADSVEADSTESARSTRALEREARRMDRIEKRSSSRGMRAEAAAIARAQASELREAERARRDQVKMLKREISGTAREERRGRRLERRRGIEERAAARTMSRMVRRDGLFEQRGGRIDWLTQRRARRLGVSLEAGPQIDEPKALVMRTGAYDWQAAGLPEPLPGRGD